MSTSVTQMMHAFAQAAVNVAEGYPNFAWTPAQQAILDRFARHVESRGQV